MSLIADPRQWAQHTFGPARLGHARRTARLVFSAARIAEHPQKSFPQLFNWDELRAFYRLCDQPDASLRAVQRHHWELTRQAMGQLPLALLVHDTTELDFSSHKALEGAGPIGDGNGRGFLQHNSLAFSPDGARLLGLAYQQLKTRRPAPKKETRRARKKRDRESQMWLEGIEAVGRPPPGSTWVDVGDRGADVYEAMEASRGAGHEFLFRACQNRLVFDSPEKDREVYLMEYARGLPGGAEDVVEVPGRGGRPPRSARVRLAAAPVWVPPPKTAARPKSRPVLAAWVLRVWEPEPPEGVKEPLEWVLLSSLPAEGPEQMRQRRDWYAVRWGAEVYHDVEKNGCAEEQRRFETAGRMETCLAVPAVVAVRVYQLLLAGREAAAAPAGEVASAEEVEVLSRWLGEGECPTARAFVRGVARLGGFLGRARDGEPGVRSLWRGYQRLQDMLAGYRLHRGPPSGSL